MTIIKGETKRGQQLLASARVDKGVELWNVYDSFSAEKGHSFELCKQMCYEENGTNFHICSSNSWAYSVAWQVEDGVRMETSRNSYLIKGVQL